MNQKDRYKESLEAVNRSIDELIKQRDDINMELEKCDYPCVKISGKDVILFTAPETGFVVSWSNRAWEGGWFSDGWSESLFTPLTGTILFDNGKPVIL